MTEAWLGHDQRLDEELVDALLELTIGLTHALQRINETLKTSLMRAIVIQVLR